MRLNATVWICLLLLSAGCAGDDEPGDPNSDLPDYDLSCASTAWPTTAPDPLLVAGTVRELATASQSGVADALVEAILAADGSVEDSDVSTAGFAYSLSIPTGQIAADRFQRVSKSGYVTSYTWPPFALYAEEPNSTAWTMSNAERAMQALLSGITLDPTRGILSVLVLDCSGVPMAGATVSLAGQGVTVVYQDELGAPDPSAAQTSASGLVTIFNVSPGSVQVTVNWQGTIFRPRTVQMFADSFGFSSRHP